MIEVLYRDDDIVVLVKPRGVLSAVDSSGAASLPEFIKKDLGVSEVFPIHRLDREVSGLMVYALSKKAAADLSAQATDHTKFVKEYLAFVEGSPENDSGVFEDLLFKDSGRNKTYVVKRERRGVKKAKLSYTVLERFNTGTLVRVKLYTGRTHQIRVQFASRKMPIVGDRKYGGRANERGIELYSFRISFIHPITGEKLDYKYIPEGIKEFCYE
ncbi:MAG: RluA family pseudouridine synthase [Clostridia bacterium]|nr:RluA family pseudouridine synthase [Clostridia bacterium]